MKALSILIDNSGKTIGARLLDNQNQIIDLTTQQLKNSSIKIENAIITNTGYIRAKSGNLKKVKITNKINKRNLNIIENYILMLQNTPILKINRKSGHIEVYNENLIPLDLYLEYDEYADYMNNIIVFNWWCANRILSLDREHSKAILNSCGLRQATTDKERADISLKYKCLSLRDFYWVKSEDNTSTWETINLFDNSLSNAVVNIALKGENLSITNKNLINSDLTTDGIFPKAWYRKDKTFYLYKGNSNINNNNSIDKEVRASEILQQLGFDVLNYYKVVYNGEVVSACKCFTSKEIGYITAGNLNQNYDLNTSYKEYDIMNLCDYLVGNNDRHQDNWGYLFNTKREIISFGKIFDFNHSFEGSEQNLCLPEKLLGKHITMLDIAKQIVKKYNIKLQKLSDTDEYTNFVNKRIDLLYK